MKILLTGVTGQLGKEIIKNKPEGVKIISKDRLELDLLSKKSCIDAINNIKPDWIINCAAYTNVDKAEDEKDLAYRINSLAPNFFSEGIMKYGGDLLHVSTDYVFNGRKGSPYYPTDKKSPINNYGYTKSKGEDFILDKLSNLNKGHIIRTSWLMSPYGNNFALKILNLLRSKNELKVISDQIGSPTTANSLAKVCWKSIKLKSKGIKIPHIMHYSDSGVASWYDIAISLEEISREINLLNNETRILPIPSTSYPSKVKRPAYSVLDSFETLDKLSLEPIYWRKSIFNLLKNFKELQSK